MRTGAQRERHPQAAQTRTHHARIRLLRSHEKPETRGPEKSWARPLSSPVSHPDEATRPDRLDILPWNHDRSRDLVTCERRAYQMDGRTPWPASRPALTKEPAPALVGLSAADLA
jgi:hypothetical protein